MLFVGQLFVDCLLIGNIKMLQVVIGVSVKVFYDCWYWFENVVVIILGDMDLVLFGWLIVKNFVDWKGVGFKFVDFDFGKFDFKQLVFVVIVELLLFVVVMLGVVWFWEFKNDIRIMNQNWLVDVFVI